MKNVLLKSLVVFAVMSILNVELINGSKKILDPEYKKVSGIQYSMLYIELVFISIIGLITVMIFRRNYDSIFRISVLFETLYVLMLMISGINPFLYFSDSSDLNLTKMMFYINSFFVLLLMYLCHLLYLKIFSSNTKS